MISQSCPRCGSYRIRRGYRATPFWWKLFGRYNLLCNGCNWEFVGFALPGTVDSPTHRKRKKREETDKSKSSQTVGNNNGSSEEYKAQSSSNGKSRRVKVKKRVNVKLKE